MEKRAAEIERFVRQHNIEHYRKLLGELIDPLRRQQLQMLLAELEPTRQCNRELTAQSRGAVTDF
jgi:hypothetical protein